MSSQHDRSDRLYISFCLKVGNELSPLDLISQFEKEDDIKATLLLTFSYKKNFISTLKCNRLVKEPALCCGVNLVKLVILHSMVSDPCPLLFLFCFVLFLGVKNLITFKSEPLEFKGSCHTKNRR